VVAARQEAVSPAGVHVLYIIIVVVVIIIVYDGGDQRKEKKLIKVVLRGRQEKYGPWIKNETLSTFGRPASGDLFLSFISPFFVLNHQASDDRVARKGFVVMSIVSAGCTTNFRFILLYIQEM